MATLTVSQAARLAHVSRQTIHNELAAGRLQAQQTTPEPNSPYLIERSAFDAWLAQRNRAQAAKA